jgi:hypothetical protein
MVPVVAIGCGISYEKALFGEPGGDGSLIIPADPAFPAIYGVSNGRSRVVKKS